ncbi:hypothetical protein OG216_00140 [Streptomycetaceae bacterium NBC_01309]
MDPVDVGAADEVVLVFGPVAALEQVVGRLTECGVLADPAPVLPDADHPVRGSCVLRTTEQGGGRTPGRGRGSGRRKAKAPAGILDSLAAWLRRPGHDNARRPQDPSESRPGRHRARTNA